MYESWYTLYERTLTLRKRVSGISRENTENTLTVERIIDAGIAIADREGLASVSIRRIAADLQASPMALYHHVPSKRDLLNGMLDATSAEFEPPAEPIAGWRDVLTHFAQESRMSLKRHPWVTAIRAADPEYGPDSIRVLEWLLTSLIECGLDNKTAARTLGILFVFVNGFVAEETASAGKEARFSKPALASGKFPHVARFVAMDTEPADDKGFQRALTLILNGIATEIDAQKTAEPRRRKTTTA